MFLGKVPSELSEKFVITEVENSSSDSLLFRMNNFSLMRSLDIHEDPTFIPEVAAGVTEDKLEAKSPSDVIKQLTDARSVCDVEERSGRTHVLALLG